MTTARELVFERIDMVDDRIDRLIQRVDANGDLGAYVGRTVSNIVPSLIEMITEIVKTIGDEELMEIVTAKMAVMRFEQDRFKEEGESE